MPDELDAVKEGLELLVLPSTPAALRIECHHDDGVGLLIADNEARAFFSQFREELLRIEIGGHGRLFRPSALVSKSRPGCGGRHEANGADELSACNHLLHPPADTAF